MRNDDGELIAGLIGSAVWEMLHVNVIWVSDELRGQGYGSKLLRQAESEAKELGCEFVKLHTFSFQAAFPPTVPPPLGRGNLLNDFVCFGYEAGFLEIDSIRKIWSLTSPKRT